MWRSESSGLKYPRLLTSHEGSDGVDIWNLNDESMVKVPTGAGHRGDTTAIVWIRRDDSVEDGLVYGTLAGLLIVWKETREKGTTVCGRFI